MPRDGLPLMDDLASRDGRTHKWSRGGAGGSRDVAGAHHVVQSIEGTIVLLLSYRTAFCALSALLAGCNVNKLPVFMSAEEFKSTPRNQPLY
jgi:hypothetical protein